MGFAFLSQAAFYLPSLLAHLLALGIAAFVSTRSKPAAACLVVGTVLQLLASAGSFGVYVFSTWAYTQGEWPAVEISTVTGVVAFFATVAGTLGDLGVAAAVAVAVLRPGAAPVAERHPYGFPG